ncbi:MAG: nucleotide sugar dehydrogenase [Candidatus Heimdallarchaeota archaeon]
MTEKIAVIGMGYVGIPMAALLADVDGYDVTGIQRRSKRSGWKIDALNAGESPFKGEEPGLEELIRRVVDKKAFRVTDDKTMLKDMDIILIDVQTPTDSADHAPQYLSLREVSRDIGTYIQQDALVITESTVAPGTTQHVIQPIIEQKSGLKAGSDFSLAYSYERVMPGKLIEYIVHLPRIIGGTSKRCEERAKELYSNVVQAPILTTDVLSAETSKTMENAYRDVNIAFANEMALISEALGVDVFEIRELINSRSERHMHIPGAGVGGHCLPKDTWLLRYGLQMYGKTPIETRFVSLAREINDFMPRHMTNLVKKGLAKHEISLRDAVITILGVAYLEDCDDTRNTPAAPLVDFLAAYGAQVRAHDPHVQEFPESELFQDLEAAVVDADCIALVTRHNEYYDLDPAWLKSKMRTHILVDGRNVFDLGRFKQVGFTTLAIGKGNVPFAH